MRNKISSVLLASKQHHEPAEQAAIQISAWLAARGVSVTRVWPHLRTQEIRQAAHGSQLALILGGDGVMLGIGRALAGLQIPLAGVNFGRVGFLAEIPAADWQEYLEEALAGNFTRQEHLALHWRLTDGSSEQAAGFCVNDVVLARGEVARAISLELEIDGYQLSRLRCDGVIVSAPLGATAYAASAGGPLTFPALQAQIITPICPFAGSFPPLVMPHSAAIRLTCPGEGQELRLTVDGQECYPVEAGQSLEIKGEPGQVLLLVRDPDWYLKRLTERGFILPGPGSSGQT